MESILKMKTKNIQHFYDISEDLKILYFKDNFMYYYLDVPFLTRILKNLKRKFPILRRIYDPEIRISQYCLNHSFDLSYCRTYRSAYYNVMNNLPTLIEIHSPNPNDPEIQRLLKISNKKDFLGIITISSILSKRLISKGVPEKKVLVLDGAVDIGRFELINESKDQIRKKLNLPIDKKIILYAGSLSKERGIDTIIRAAHELKDKGHIFIIIGGNIKQIKYWKTFMKKNDLSFCNY